MPFTVKSTQLSGIQDLIDVNLQAHIIEYLRKEQAEELSDLTDDMLELMTASGIKRARAFRFRKGRNILTFVVLMFVIAPNFYTHEKALVILKDYARREDDRMERLMAEMTAEDWDQAEADADDTRWFN